MPIKKKEENKKALADPFFGLPLVTYSPDGLAGTLRLSISFSQTMTQDDKWLKITNGKLLKITQSYKWQITNDIILQLT